MREIKTGATERKLRTKEGATGQGGVGNDSMTAREVVTTVPLASNRDY